MTRQTNSEADLHALLRAVFAPFIAEEVNRALAQLERVDQNASPLGRRRHVAAAKRFIAAGVEGAGRAGRRYFLTRSLIDEELSRLGREQVEAVERKQEDDAALLAELGLERGRRSA